VETRGGEEAPAASENELKVGVSVVPGETVQPTQVTVQPTQVTVQPTYSYCSPFGDSYSWELGLLGWLHQLLLLSVSGTCRWRWPRLLGRFSRLLVGSSWLLVRIYELLLRVLGLFPVVRRLFHRLGILLWLLGAVRMAGIVPCAELGGGVDQVGVCAIDSDSASIVTSSSLPSKEVVPAAYVARISAERATRIAELARSNGVNWLSSRRAAGECCRCPTSFEHSGPGTCQPVLQRGVQCLLAT
jgi:hypothetical protein